MSKSYHKDGASVWSQLIVCCLLVGLSIGGYLFAKSDQGEERVNLCLLYTSDAADE